MSAAKEADPRCGSDAPREVHSKSKSIDSQTLFGGAETVVIHHLGLTYTLRKTRNGKLILNK
jgi:hemin uptake protein HemP